MRITLLSISLALLMLSVVPVARAMQTTVVHQDIPNCCDFLFVPPVVDELGTFIFPANETITSSDQLISYIACPSQANPATLSTEVIITNQTGRSFNRLWYVGDPETTFTNTDGVVNNGHATRIDSVGINRPLIIESINTNGIFEPTETWHFVLDDYFNTFGLPANAMQSIGVGIFSGGDQKSAGSIIATPVPEPAAGLLAVIGLGLAVRRSRRFFN